MSGHATAELTGEGSKWFQLYFLGGRPGAEQLVERAARAGYETLVVTIDTAVPGNRERDLAFGASLPLRVDRQTMRRFAPYVATKPRWLADVARDHFTLTLAHAVGLEHSGKVLSEDEALIHSGPRSTDL
jgi:isopentenyl diphosphate isomerase/L-lactate dehydrogenase-like FMN-dependent dehydrogenase